VPTNLALIFPIEGCESYGLVSEVDTKIKGYTVLRVHIIGVVISHIDVAVR
jgi:hypothetical protein